MFFIIFCTLLRSLCKPDELGNVLQAYALLPDVLAYLRNVFTEFLALVLNHFRNVLHVLENAQNANEHERSKHREHDHCHSRYHEEDVHLEEVAHIGLSIVPRLRASAIKSSRFSTTTSTMEAMATSKKNSKDGVRINKYLADQGLSTRKEADELIARGKVTVNGRPAVLGMKVQPSDTVEVRGTKNRRYVYLAVHKPKNLVTLASEKGEKDVLSLLPSDLKRMKLFPIGRLDKASSGLLIVTNDARLTDRLLHPDREHEKTYVVTTKKPLRESFKHYMEEGVNIEGYVTKPAKVRIMGEKKFQITLTEGKKHQIRRMVVAMHNEVNDLSRTGIMNIKIGGLPSGGFRTIEGKELATLLTSLGL